MPSSPKPFSYPAGALKRIHGPGGYANYQSYRDWLRDEFSFRCVFCLQREQWGIVLGGWDIDHFVAQSRDVSLKIDYDNLLYVCRACNALKSDHCLPDPCTLDLSKCLLVKDDGSLEALNDEGRLIAEILRLDSDDRRRLRRMIIATVRSLSRHDPDSFKMWMRYPDTLPDLEKLRPPTNSRPEGIDKSAFARRRRGELPEVY
jgi:hypothetical protein